MLTVAKAQGLPLAGENDLPGMDQRPPTYDVYLRARIDRASIETTVAISLRTNLPCLYVQRL